MGILLGEILFLRETINYPRLELRIKQVAKETSFKMKDIAEGVGITSTYLSRIVNGDVRPNVAKLQEIADFMQVPVHRLIVAPEGFIHFYNENREWLGLVKFSGSRIDLEDSKQS